MATANEPLLKIDELAVRLRTKRRAVERMVQARKIPVVRINRRVLRFRWSEVEKALAKLTIKEL
jgi:excisionase family DNA binding protein